MYHQHSTLYRTKEQTFNEKFPLSIVATLAVTQMLTTFAIFALEIAHNALHLKLTNLLVGFWTAIPFTILWISMFSVVCCCRRQSCATHAVIQNILGFLFAGVLIGIDIAFIQQPNKCFFTEGICRTLFWTSYISDPIECLVDGLTTDCGNTRITFIKAQLAAGVLMAVTCLIYLIIYTIILTRVSKLNRSKVATAAEAVMTPVYQPNLTQVPLTVSHHHQSCSISSQPYQDSTPILMAVRPPQVPSDRNYINYIPSNQYATIHSQRTNERF